MLGITNKPVAALIPHARNARTHSPDQVQAIADSIKKWKFNNPVLLHKDGTIIAGHGRVLAAELLGLKQIPTISLDHLTPDEARAYMIADNQLALRAGWDFEMLASEVVELKEQGVDLKLLGFEDDELERLHALVNPDEVGFPEIASGPKSEFEQITFTLHADQAQVIKEAVNKAIELGYGLNENNKNKNGNALCGIASDWLHANS